MNHVNWLKTKQLLHLILCTKLFSLKYSFARKGGMRKIVTHLCLTDLGFIFLSLLFAVLPTKHKR